MKSKQARKKQAPVNGIKVEVYLDDTDVMILNDHGIDKFRQHLIEKYAWGFYDSGQPLTIDDLAFFLHSTPEIILEDIEIIQNEKGILLPIIGSRSWPEFSKQNGKNIEKNSASSTP